MTDKECCREDCEEKDPQSCEKEDCPVTTDPCGKDGCSITDTEGCEEEDCPKSD